MLSTISYSFEFEKTPLTEKSLQEVGEFGCCITVNDISEQFLNVKVVTSEKRFSLLLPQTEVASPSPPDFAPRLLDF